jgi:hypothetical protein
MEPERGDGTRTRVVHAVGGQSPTPPTNRTQDRQAQNQVRGRLAVRGFPSRVPQASGSPRRSPPWETCRSPHRDGTDRLTGRQGALIVRLAGRCPRGSLAAAKTFPAHEAHPGELVRRSPESGGK